MVFHRCTFPLPPHTQMDFKKFIAKSLRGTADIVESASVREFRIVLRDLVDPDKNDAPKKLEAAKPDEKVKRVA